MAINNYVFDHSIELSRHREPAENPRLRPLHDLKLILMSEICHDPDFKYILIALNRLMNCLFPLNSAKLSFRDSVGRAKPNGVRKGAKEPEERGAGVDENANRGYT